MPMLNGVLQLHDLPDVEQLARKVLRDRAHSYGGGLGTALPHHLEEAIIDDLILLAWRLSGLDGNLQPLPLEQRPRGTWNPTLTPSYRTYITGILHRRVPDSYRRHIHDTRAPKPTLEPLDTTDPGHDRNTNSRLDPLERALTTSANDPATNRSTDLARLLLHRDRGNAQHHHQEHQQAHGRAA